MALTKISTGGVKDDAASQAKIADEAIDEARLQVSNAGTNGQFLQKSSGTGGLTWADATTDVSGKANLSGAAFTGSVTIADGQSITAGSSSGLSIRHEAVNNGVAVNLNYIEDSSDGGIKYRSGQSHQFTGRVSPNHNELQAKFICDGAAELYHAGSKKIETTSSGVNITGTLNVNGSALSTAPQITANASGALAAGDLVIANSNGTVSKIKNTYTEKSSYATGGGQGYSNGSNVNYPKICHDSNNNKLYLAFQNTDNNKGMISIGAPNGNETGNNVSWSTPDEFIGSTGEVYGVAWSTTSERGVVVYKAASSSVYCKAFKLDAGETTVTYGSQCTILGGGACDHIDISWDKTADKFLVVIGNNNTDLFPTRQSGTGMNNNTIAAVISVNDVTCTRGTPLVMTSESHQSKGLSLAYDPDNNKHLAIYADSGNSDYLTACIITISGTTVTANTEVAGGGSDGNIAAYDTDVVYVGGGDFVFYYHQTDNDTKARFVTVSGTTPSMGADTSNLGDTVTGYINNNVTAVYDERTEKVATAWLSSSGPRDGKLTWLTLNKTNHTLSVHLATSIQGSSIKSQSGTYNSTNNMSVFGYNDNSGNAVSKNVSTVDVTTNLSTAYIGTSAGSYADGAAATINVVGATDSNQSGLTAGVKYYVNNDGTLSTGGGDTKVFAGTAVSASKIIVNEGPQDYSPMVLLQEKRLSNELNPTYSNWITEIDFTGFLSDEYDSYILKIYNLSRNPPSMTDQFTLKLRWFFDSTLYTSSTYYWDATGRTFGYNTDRTTNSSGGDSGNGNTAVDHIKCHLSHGLASYTGEMEFPNLGKDNAQHFVRGWMADQKNPWLNGQHAYFWGKEKNTNTSGGNENKCTGFRLYMDNDCSGGRLKLYGLK